MGIKYDNDWPIVALCYDFDKTLSPKDMQNFELIPSLGVSEAEFWGETDKLSHENGMDKILSYMKMIVDRAAVSRIKISRKDFNKLGKSIELFKGVDTWFKRINKIARSAGVNIEHYIISAGLKEIIEGTSIAKYFTEIYASCFLYDEYDRPVWPARVVNYTTKTQYLFRINKDCPDLSDEEKVNRYLPSDKRRIPFSNFIYIGDSETDIPAMNIVKLNGGCSVGVFNPDKGSAVVSKLLEEGRIDYLMPADYSEGSTLENLIKTVLKNIKLRYELKSFKG